MSDPAWVDDDGKFGCRRSEMYSVVHLLFGSYSPLLRLRVPRGLRCQRARETAKVAADIDRHNNEWSATIKQNKVVAVLHVCRYRCSPLLLC